MESFEYRANQAYEVLLAHNSFPLTGYCQLRGPRKVEHADAWPHQI